jgi:hypothetical protein
VATLSKAWTVFALTNNEIVVSIPIRSMNVCVPLFCVCVVVCVGIRLADPLYKESYLLCIGPWSWKCSQGPTMSCRAVIIVKRNNILLHEISCNSDFCLHFKPFATMYIYVSIGLYHLWLLEWRLDAFVIRYVVISGKCLCHIPQLAIKYEFYFLCRTLLKFLSLQFELSLDKVLEYCCRRILVSFQTEI